MLHRLRFISAVVLASSVVVVRAASAQTSVTLAWDASPDAAGYVVFLGTAPGSYTFSSDVGNRTSCVLYPQSATQKYYVSVQSYDANGIRSDYARELSFDVSSLPAPNDWDRNGSTDLLWQHATQGWLALWQMDGTRLLNGGYLSPNRITDTALRIAGTGDFNLDGSPDLLWQNDTTGELTVWYMSGATRLSSVPVSPATVDLNWRVVGVADFDRDGQPDLLFQHRVTQDLAVWFMSGVKQRNGNYVSNVPSASGWRVAGLADMNRDGRVDIVWQRDADGKVAAWLLDGTQLVDGVMLSPAQVSDPRWKIQVVADVDRDGWADVIWRNDATGALAVWLMRGTQLRDGSGLGVSVPDLNWKMVGPR